MATTYNWLMSGILLLTFINIGSTLRCYECTEVKGEWCAYRREHVNFTLPCRESQVCVTHWMPAGRIAGNDIPEQIKRACGDKDYCQLGINMIEEVSGITLSTRNCTTCSEDLCNSATNRVLSIFSILFVVFLKYLL